MAEVYCWTVPILDGHAWGLREYDDYGEAEDEARSIGGVVVEHTYAWVGSEEVIDFRPRCDHCGRSLRSVDDATAPLCARCVEKAAGEADEVGEGSTDAVE